MEPINYMRDVKDPFQSVMQGFQIGSQIKASQEARAEAERKRLAQAAMQEEFNGLAADPKAENIVKFSLKYPAMSENLKRGLDMLNETQRADAVSHATDIYSALSAGKPDIASDLLKQKIEEHKNSGNTAAQRSAELMLKLVESSPETAQTQAGLVLANSMGPDKFADTFTKIGEERRKQELHDPETAKAKERAELDKLLAELDQLKKTGGIDPTKKFDMEDKLRKEYNALTQPMRLTQSAYQRITDSEDNAMGDIAMIFNYMKMLDPGSVVREGEFATAQNAAGVPDRVLNQYNRALEGTRLSKDQRNQIISQSGRIFSGSKKQENEIRAGLSRAAGKYGLDKESIFYSPEGVETPSRSAMPADAEKPAQAGAISTKTQDLLSKYGPK